MKIAARFLIFGVITALSLLVATTSVHAQAVTVLSDQQIEQVKTNCQSVKGTLNQLHASDALLRVNRGQVYESMASRLMDPFNTRLSNSRLDTKATSAVITAYRTTLDTFRSDYQNYEEHLSSTLRIDCQTQPAAFYRATEEVRGLRAVVHTDVQRLNRYIDDYRSAVSDFWLNYQRTSE